MAISCRAFKHIYIWAFALPLTMVISACNLLAFPTPIHTATEVIKPTTNLATHTNATSCVSTPVKVANSKVYSFFWSNGGKMVIFTQDSEFRMSSPYNVEWLAFNPVTRTVFFLQMFKDVLLLRLTLQKYPHLAGFGPLDTFLVFFHVFIPIINPWVVLCCLWIEFIQACTFGDADDQHQLPAIPEQQQLLKAGITKAPGHFGPLFKLCRMVVQVFFL